jgi:Bifunctional DNA primase/polymerase, N-terminal
MATNNGNHSGHEELDKLYKLLGKVVFLPIPLGEKGPKEKEWQQSTFAGITPAVLKAANRGGNLGVLLGPASNRLFALDLDNDSFIEQWIDRVPWLANTLRSKGKRGCQFWMRLEQGCDYPSAEAVHKLVDPKTKIKIGELRLGGGGKGAQSVIFGLHPEGNRYQIVVDKPPLEISLADLDELVPSEYLKKCSEEKAGTNGNYAPPAAGQNTVGSTTNLWRRVTAYLDKCEPAVSGQRGHDTTFRVLCQVIRGFDLSPDDAWRAALYYNVKCEPVWSEKDLRHKVDEALKVTAADSRGELLKDDGEPAFSRKLKEQQVVRTEAAERAGARVQIILGTKRLESEFCEDVGKVLAPLDVVFRRDDTVVEIQDEQFTGELDRFKLARGGMKFSTLTPAAVRTSFEQYIQPGIKDKDGEFVARTMSESSARTLLVSPQFLKQIPRISRILDVPIPLRLASGAIVFPRPGFTRSLGIYCAPGAPEINELPLEQAIKIIEQAIAGFCWKSPQSKVHAIARMITPYARGIMGFSERIPLWFFIGNRPRCGKDYLNGVTQIIYQGHAFEDAPITDNYEETNKRIVSALRAGRRMMHFANCQHHLNDPGFIQAITGPTINARSLGSNDAKSDLELPNEIDYSLSANIGLTYREDVEPRLRKIELAFFEEDPNKREFPNPFLHDWIKPNRGEVLSAIHSLIKHWEKQGTKPGTTLFNSFPRWAEVVGGIMVACGLGDPCLAHEGEDLIGGDQKEIAMKALFQLAFEDSPGAWIRKVDIYDIIRQQCENNDRLSWFGDFDGDSNEKSFATKRIGKALSAFQNRILGGIRLEIDTSTEKSQQWRYRFAKAF